MLDRSEMTPKEMAIADLFEMRGAALAVIMRPLNEVTRAEAMLRLHTIIERSAWVDDAAQGIVE